MAGPDPAVAQFLQSLKQRGLSALQIQQLAGLQGNPEAWQEQMGQFDQQQAQGGANAFAGIGGPPPQTPVPFANGNTDPSQSFMRDSHGSIGNDLANIGHGVGSVGNALHNIFGSHKNKRRR